MEGIGFRKAEQITYQSEIILTPNASFSDMRDASILISQQLYGVDSFEEIQTTNAWHAVCVGLRYVNPAPNQVFFSSTNIAFVRESSDAFGCTASRTYDIAVTSVKLDAPISITIDSSSSTADEDVDFKLSRNVLDLEGTSNEIIQVTIFDDALNEEDEEIILSFSYNGEPRIQNILVLDDDSVPNIGFTPIQLLETETFNVSEIPFGWTELSIIDPSTNSWYYNGDGTEAGRAYISFNSPVVNNSAIYRPNAPSNVILISPEINAVGFGEIRVTFDWEAGGQFNPNPSGTPFNYGQLVYSFDGVNFEDGSDHFVLDENGVQSGTFDEVIPALQNSKFFIGFRWFNRSNGTNSIFSFAVDNVSITASPSNVARVEGSTVSNAVNQGNDIYFSSTSDGSIIARLESASEDLGCVETTLTGEGTGVVTNNQAGVNRSEKVIQITPDGPNAATATYNVTFYMTTEELASFADVSAMRIMKVDGNDINATTNDNTSINGALLEDLRDTEGYATFRGSFTGFSSFAMVEPAVASVNDIAVSGIALYPSPVSRGNNITISTKDIAITSAVVFDVRGAQVANQKFERQTDVQLNTSTLQTGFYFVRLNNDKNKTFKFVVK